MIEFAIQNLTSVLLAFILLGVQEAIIKPIAKTLIKRKIIKYAPAAMQYLDERVPAAFSRYNSKEMSYQLKARLESITGESWKDNEINEMFKIYDPRITADKCLP
jgi:hypothetical protein